MIGNVNAIGSNFQKRQQDMRRWIGASTVAILLFSLLSVLNVSAETREIFNVDDLYTTHGGQDSSENGADNAEVAVVVIDEDGNRREILFSDPQVEDTRNLSWAEFEKLYPPDRDAEKIVHPIPERSIIIDGTRYNPEDISQFDGQVLRFIEDERTEKEGVLYAFTTREGVEDYMKREWGWSEKNSSTSSAAVNAPNTVFSKYWRDAFYSGSRLEVSPGAALPDLSIVGFNDIISSLQIGPDTSTSIMYDLQNYADDQLIKQRNQSSSVLVFMNDRISSIRTFN